MNGSGKWSDNSAILHEKTCYTGIAVLVVAGGVACLVATMIPASPSLAVLLKTLRERAGVTVAALAKRTGLAESAIYKAEGGSRTVRWRTLETGYRDFCETPEEQAELLALWARGQCEEAPAAEAMRAALAKHGPSALTEAEEKLLAEFVNSYHASGATRGMARAWMTALRER